MPMMPGDEVILSERANGTSTAAIGRVLGRGKNSIAGRINRLRRMGLITETFASPIHAKGEPPRYAIARAPDARPRLSRAVRAPTVTLSPIEPTEPLPMSGRCKYPLWRDDEAPTHVYCTRPARLGSSYCPAHRAVCYARGAGQ